MAAESTKRIILEYPDFSKHDVVVTSLFYSKEKDIYFMIYFDLTLNQTMYTVLSKVNGRLIKNPFMELDKINELVDLMPVDLDVLSDRIGCLKEELKKPLEQRVARFDVFTNGHDYYIRRNIANRFGITGNGSSTIKGDEWVRVNHSDIELIIDQTKNDAVMLEPTYHPLFDTKKQAEFIVLDDDVNLYITTSLAKEFGVGYGFGLRYESMSWTKVTLEEVKSIEERTKNSKVSLIANFKRISREDTRFVINNNGPKTMTSVKSAFRVLDDGDDLFIDRRLARAFGVDHGYAFNRSGIEWTRVSLADIKKIEQNSLNTNNPLEARFEQIEKVNKLKPTRLFTVVLELLNDNNDLYIRKEVADRFGIISKAQAYDSFVWLKVTEDDLARIKKSYNDRGVLLEYKTVQKKHLNDNEFEVLVDGENQYISVELINRFGIDNTGVINVKGKNYCKVLDTDIKRIIALTFYSDKSLTPKYIKITKEKVENKTTSKKIVLTVCYLGDKIFVPADLPINMEMDLMTGKKIRIDGAIYVSVSRNRYQEIYNELRYNGYDVILRRPEIEKVNKNNNINKITK